jgi:hypothetical protein
LAILHPKKVDVKVDGETCSFRAWVGESVDSGFMSCEKIWHVALKKS